MMREKDLQSRIMHVVERSPGQRASYKQLVRELAVGGGRERRALLEQLEGMTSRRMLAQVDREHWGMPHSPAPATDRNLIGRLDVHRDGFGFVRPGDRKTGGEDDIFIPPDSLLGAMQGDQVLVAVDPPKRDGRKSGRVLRIMTRRNATVVGTFHYAREAVRPGRASGPHREHSPWQRIEGGNYVIPLDERITQPILIPPGAEVPKIGGGGTPHRVLGQEAHVRTSADSNDLEGLAVDVEITDWASPTRPARGHVIEVLGDQEDFGVDVEIVIRKHHLPHVFPNNVLAEARAVAALPELETGHEPGRRDFRGLPIVTIDGETARDFDDAVMVRDAGSGRHELQVHIADVAHYVTPGSALDFEARVRGTSVYFPDRAIPMLPAELSTDICSLRPGEDRLVLSCIMQIGSNGEVEDYEICEGVIRSARRMTYTQVGAIVRNESGEDRAVRAQFGELTPEFDRMYSLARVLNLKRVRRGSIDFDLPEAVISFDEQGAMQGVVQSERDWANRLIEEFMLAANECVAGHIERLGVPSLYRIHEKPDAKRIVEFEELAAGFGYTLGIGNLPVRRFQTRGERREQHGRGRNPRQHEVAEEIVVTPQMYQRLSAKLAGKPEERILSYLMLRSLKQARYSAENEGHFALAAASYTHFTSPIRRYPDLIVHRILKALLGGSAPASPGQIKAEKWRAGEIDPPLAESEMGVIAQESSQAERRAADAERELIEWKKIRFMQDRVGEDFQAIVLSVTKYGMFVELTELFVEGLVPILSLHGDHFTFRENTRQIVGERSGRKYSIGDRVHVLLDRVNRQERRMQFALIEDQATAGSTSVRSAKAGRSREISGSKSHPYKPPAKKKLKAMRRRNGGAKKKRH